MISSETPYKLAEIIRDTWVQHYRPFKAKCSEDDESNDEEIQ